MFRPELNSKLSATEFQSWYWLKEELLVFCRQAGLPSAGSKPELNSRISAYLEGRPINAAPRRSPKGDMPSEFALDTVIGEGWRCNPALGAFLRSHCGNGFRFNAAVRDFVHTQVGRSLADVITCFRASVAPGAPQREIPAQLEYNNHTRQFYAQNPGATRQQVLDAWWEKRSKRTKQ